MTEHPAPPLGTENVCLTNKSVLRPPPAVDKAVRRGVNDEVCDEVYCDEVFVIRHRHLCLARVFNIDHVAVLGQNASSFDMKDQRFTRRAMMEDGMIEMLVVKDSCLG